MTTEIRVQSWNELQERLFEGSWRPDLQRYRSPNAFRGQPVASQRLETTLVRLGGNYAEMEKHLLRNFRKYASRKEVDKDNFWNWLSLAKHHGLPTRLLDWSFSPYVALHFATENTSKFDQDGGVWAVNYMMSDPRAVFDDWLAAHPDLFQRIIIPAHLKWEVRDKLDQANVTERVLFPGLDGLSSWLKRQYSPR